MSSGLLVQKPPSNQSPVGSHNVPNTKPPLSRNSLVSGGGGGGGEMTNVNNNSITEPRPEDCTTQVSGGWCSGLFAAADMTIRHVTSVEDCGYVDTRTIIGEGAESHVVRYKAPDGNDVAVKIISKVQHPVHQQQTQEVAYLRRLAHHPSVVRYLDAMQTATHVYLVTEEFGIDLDRWQTQLKNQLMSLPLEYTESIREVTRQLVSAVRNLHRCGVVHRDIKLHNVLIRQGEVKLIDFGAACAIQETICAPIKGTLGYVPPEVLLRASSHTFTCEGSALPLLDVFALGVVVYQLLYGRAPFRVHDLGEIAKGQADPFAVKAATLLARMARPPPYYPRGLGNICVDSDAKEFVQGMLKADPSERWTLDRAMNSAWLSKRRESGA